LQINKFRKKIRFTKIAFGTKCLQIFEDCFAALAPRINMIYMKLHTQSDCWTSTTSTAFKIVALEYTPAKTERWIATRFVLVIYSNFD